MSLSRAIALAAEVHRTQTDKAGVPYILHCIRVMEDAMRVTDGDQLVGEIAVLHDVLEDFDEEQHSEKELEYRIGHQHGSFVLLNLRALKKLPEESYLESYIPRIIEAAKLGNPTVVVKMADLRDNMTILRQPTLMDEDLIRIQKYHVAYRRLREHLE